MFDYTRSIFKKTMKDVEKAFTVFHFGTQIIYLAYLLYLIFTPNKIWYLHLALLAISSAFLVYDIISTKNIISLKRERLSIFKRKSNKNKITQAKQKKARITKIKFYSSHVIKLFVLAVAFYPIIVAPDTVHPLSIMCTTVMVLLWILLVLFEIAKIMLEGRLELFTEALQADVEQITKPVTTVKNVFNKVLGKEAEPTPEPTENMIYLKSLAKADKDERDAKRAEAKAAKKEKLSAWLDSHLAKITAKREEKATVAPELPAPEQAEDSATTEEV